MLNGRSGTERNAHSPVALRKQACCCSFFYYDNVFSVLKGKWMYEILLGSKGIMQLGWATLQCKFTNEVCRCIYNKDRSKE